MSDAPEAGDPSVNFPRTEVSNHIANGQPYISQSLETKSQPGAKNETKLADSTDPIGSEIPLTNAIQGGKSLQGQMETRNTPPLTSTSINASTRTNYLLPNITGQKFQEDRLSPSKMEVGAPLTSSSPAESATESMNSIPAQFGPMQKKMNTSFSNGPPVYPVELNYKPVTSQPSSAPSMEPQPPDAPIVAPYPKSSPISSYPATSGIDSNGPKSAHLVSGPQKVNSSPLHLSGEQPLSSCSSSQPRSSPSQVPPHSVSGQQFPSYSSPQPMTFSTAQSPASFPPVSSSSLQSSIPNPPQSYPSQPAQASHFPLPGQMPQVSSHNQIPQHQPSNQIPQFSTNQIPQYPTRSQVSQPSLPGQVFQPPGPIPQPPGHIPQPPIAGQMPQPPPSAQIPQSPPTGQMHQSPPTGQMHQSPPTGQMHQSPPTGQIHQSPSIGQMPQPPLPGQKTQFPPSNQILQPRIPGQMSQFSSPNQVPQHPPQKLTNPYNPPFPQSPSLPPTSSAMSGPPGSFAPPPSSYPVPPHSSQNFPQPPMQSNHQHPGIAGPFPPSNIPRLQPPFPQNPPQGPPVGTFPPPNQMPRQQPPPMAPYVQRPVPLPMTNQPSSWVQANGIPNRMPQFDATTRQPMPSTMPMYPQEQQDMSQGMQMPPMGSNVQQQMANDPSQMSRRYPQQTGYQQYPSGTSVGNSNSVERMSSQFRGLSVTRDGFNKLWGADCYDLLQTRNILPTERVEAPKIQLHQEYLDGVNCRPEIFRCTLTKIPETNSLLQKSRLPLGILIHPFKDINNLPVVQCNTIVRCRSCRTYINPFVYFVDHRRWKCNLCFRVNDMPEEFQFDPVTKTYGDPSRRPEIRSSTIEYIAPSEYMLRPPQAAVYLFLLDVSCGAIEQGYLNTVCDVLSEELSQLPGDSRTQIGFVAYDSSLHFFALAEGLTQPQHMVISDIEEVFLPRPDNLLVNLQECKDLVQDLLAQLPTTFLNSHDTGCALGPALQAAQKLMMPTGGRITVFQTCLPTVGPGALKVRGNDGGVKEVSAQHLQAATDFYKRLSLDCSGHQVAVDLFVLGSHYTDLATLSGVSQFSGGCIHHLPHFDGRNNFEASKLERCFHRYLSRKIGFEAVMRIRCSRGLSIHTFHGHFFVRSTDLLSLPNVNPDAGFGMQVAIDESLSDLQNVCFQAALLYTSSKGERRIRVHTLCLPIAANVNDVVCAADQQCIVGLLAKMAVDRSQQSSPGDARDAFINVATDVLSTYRVTQSVGPSSGLLAPHSLRLLPLYILALLKHVAFRSGQGTRLDNRVYAMCQMKTLPLSFLMQEIYPDLYPVHNLHEQTSFKNSEGQIVPNPPRLHLSAEKLDSRGVFLLDKGETILIYVGRSVSPQFCQDVFGVPHFAAIQDDMYEIPLLGTSASELLNNFIRYLLSEKPYEATTQIIREDSRHRMHFIEKLVEDRSESALSYYEFLQHLKAQIK